MSDREWAKGDLEVRGLSKNLPTVLNALSKARKRSNRSRRNITKKG